MSASALQRAASVIGAIGSNGPGSSSSSSGRTTPTSSGVARASSLRNYSSAGGGGGSHAPGVSAAQAALQAGPHSLSLKVMRISAPSLVRAHDRAYFEVPDEAFPSDTHSGKHDAQAGKASAKARAQASALVQDISTAEAGEMQRLYAALALSSDESAPAQSSIGAAERALRSAAASDMLSNQHPPGDSSPAAALDPAIRDWPTSDVLVLPSSFGTIHLGEAFQAYICLNNETNEAVRDASLYVDIQQADREDETADRISQSGPSSNPSTVLAHVGYVPSKEGQDADISVDSQSEQERLLQPQRKLETTVRHDMRKPGGYVLGCTVTYLAWLPAPRINSFDGNQDQGQGQWIERSFRKSYRFAVPTCPLTVRSKAHAFCPLPLSSLSKPPPSSQYRWRPTTRDSILLEVQVRNDCPRALVLERSWLDTDPRSLGLLQPQDAATVGLGPPFAGWDWESIDRPWLRCGAVDSEAERAETEAQASMSRRHFGLPSLEADAEDEAMQGIWEDEDQWLLPGDTRQFIFRMTPALHPEASQTEPGAPLPTIQDLLPPPPTPKATVPPSLPSTGSAGSDLAQDTSTTRSPPPLPGKGPAPRTTRYSIRGASPTPTSAAQHPTPLPAPPLQLMVPLGKLDIAWRMAGAGGEAGRLQTSMLFWRREVAGAAVFDLAAAQAAPASRPTSLIRSPPGTPSSASTFIRLQQPH